MRRALEPNTRRWLLAAGVSAWCAAILATTLSAPALPRDVGRALGIGAAPHGAFGVAGAQARGGVADGADSAPTPAATIAGGARAATGGRSATSPAPATPARSAVKGLTVTGEAGSLLTVDGGADGVAPRLVIAGARPGSVGEMELRVRNEGGRDAVVELRRDALQDAPGTGGGRLSERLRLAVVPIGGPVGFNGALATFHSAALGTVPAGERRSWWLALRFPEGGDDNAYQGAGVSASYTLVER
jgi:hypothetical protein